MGVLAWLLGIVLFGGIGLAVALDWTEIAPMPAAFFVACVFWEVLRANNSTSVDETPSGKSYRNIFYHCTEHLGRNPATVWVAIQTGNHIVFKAIDAFLQLPGQIIFAARALIHRIIQYLAAASFATGLPILLTPLELLLRIPATSILLSANRLLRAPPTLS